MYDILQILRDNARKAIEAEEDRKFIETINAINSEYYLGKALREIPNTRWKKFKYHVKNTLGLIK